VRSLHLSGALNGVLDADGIAHFLHFGFTGGARSLFKDVRCLPPASYYSSRNGRVQRYFDLTSVTDAIDPQESSQKFNDVFSASVRDCLVSDVEVAVLLSGGIDSGLVAAAAAKIHPQIKAYSLGFSEKSFDETDKARVIAAKLKIPHRIIAFDDTWLDAMADYAIEVSDPIADSSILATRLLCREVAKRQKVVLSGDGADELFAGYELYRFEAMRRKHGIAFALARWPLKAILSLSGVSGAKNSLVNRLKRLIDLPRKDPALSHVFLRGIWNTFDAAKLLNPDLCAHPSLLDQAQDYADLYRHPGFEEQANPTDLDRSLYADFSYHLPGDMLAKVDRASMAFGLEVRVPFLNPAMIRMAFALDDRSKISGLSFQSKVLLRAEFEKIFGRKLAWQKKAGFSVPLRPYFDKLLASSEWEGFGMAIDGSGLFKKDWKATLTSAYRSRKHQMENGLFAIVVLEKWLQEYALR
jgi:asparagine synthase (glutamine-hydrolysing)